MLGPLGGEVADEGLGHDRRDRGQEEVVQQEGGDDLKEGDPEDHDQEEEDEERNDPSGCRRYPAA